MLRQYNKAKKTYWAVFVTFVTNRGSILPHCIRAALVLNDPAECLPSAASFCGIYFSFLLQHIDNNNIILFIHLIRITQKTR